MNKLYVMAGNIEVASIENGHLKILNDSLAPLYLKRTLDFDTWVADRAVDPTRPNARVLKKLHGISMLASDFDTAMLYNAASVTDNFWVKKEVGETWDSIRFKDDFYFKAAVRTDTDAFGRKPTRSPELTNIGSLEKGWRLIDGEWWLFKNETEEKQKAELLTYEIGSVLGFDMAYYEICDGLIRTKDFTEGKYNLQHIDGFVCDHDGINEEDIKYNYETLNNVSPDLAKAYMDIRCLDALVNNVDRHVKNCGVLTDRESGKIVSLAPNYDNDMAFYGYPDILNNENRERGEIKFFLEALRDIPYELPELDEEKFERILCKYENPSGLKQYIMRGYELIESRLTVCETEEELCL